MMNTDTTWKWYGEQDPYFGVLTEEAYRTGNLSPEKKQAFFETGRRHVSTLLDALAESGFSVRKERVCDFGCGVGRLLLPFAEIFEHAVGIDVSPGMLRECRSNAAEKGLTNIELRESDDNLSSLKAGEFDLVHSFIVLQHIPYERGLVLVRRLLECVKPGGIACLHIQYAGFPLIQGTGLKTAAKRLVAKLTDRLRPSSEMLMNAYPLNQTFELFDELGFGECKAVYTKTTRGGIFIWAQRTCKFPYSAVF